MQTVRKNQRDARELALYIAQVADAILRRPGDHDISDEMKEQLDVFRRSEPLPVTLRVGDADITGQRNRARQSRYEETSVAEVLA